MRRSIALFCTTVIALFATNCAFHQNFQIRGVGPSSSKSGLNLRESLHSCKRRNNLNSSPCFRRRLRLRYSTDDNKPNPTAKSFAPPSILSWAMVAIPILSLGFLPLLNLAKTLPPNSSAQFIVVAVLFVSNRAYLYLMAVTIVGLAAFRGSMDDVKLGRRITDLTEELLYRPSIQGKIAVNDDGIVDESNPTQQEKPAFIQSLSKSGLEDSLDQITPEAQALALPVLVSFLLALSIFFFPFWSKAPFEVTNTELNTGLQDLAAKILPLVSQVWNLVLLALFTRSEVRRLALETKVAPDSAILEWVAAISITWLACWAKIWPAQNFVNMSLAILVSRAIQLESFQAVVGSLALLTLYDATSVFLIPAAGASDILMEHQSVPSLSGMMMAASPDAVGVSAMGSVAIQKLTSTTFQPGLLVTKIGNSLGGSLGLGDAVFPSVLANFAKRFDDSKGAEKDRLSLFPVSLVGYLLGCASCEFAPTISTSGIPALLFIIPVMLGAVIVASVISGELGELSAFRARKN